SDLLVGKGTPEMRIVSLPAGFYRVNRREGSNVPVDALRRAVIVEWIDERRRRGVARVEACRLVGVSTRRYDRWRRTLKRYGVRAPAARSSCPHNTRVTSKRRQVVGDVERLRKLHPMDKEK